MRATHASQRKLNFIGGTHESTTETRERKTKAARPLFRKSVLRPAKASAGRWRFLSRWQQRFCRRAEERGTYSRCRRWSCKIKTTRTSCPNPRYRNSPCHFKRYRNRSPSCRKNSFKNRPAPLCAMRCAMCPASLSPPAKAAEIRVTFSSCAGLTPATTRTSMACVIPAPIFAIRLILTPSKY